MIKHSRSCWRKSLARTALSRSSKNHTITEMWDQSCLRDGIFSRYRIRSRGCGIGIIFCAKPQNRYYIPEKSRGSGIIFGVSRNPENSRSFRDSDSFGILGIRNFLLSGFYSRASRFFLSLGFPENFYHNDRDILVGWDISTKSQLLSKTLLKFWNSCDPRLISCETSGDFESSSAASSSNFRALFLP